MRAILKAPLVDIRIKKLFNRYQAGKATEKEKKLVEDWFAGFDDQQQEILNEKKAGFFDEMDQEIHNLFPVYERKYQLATPWLQAAAVLLVGVGIFLFKVYKSRQLPEKPVTYTLISAAKGTKKQFTLPDGSFVYLNSGSDIRVPSNFGIKDRQVLLSGEAFFAVIHNPAKPFTIKTGKLIIADIGTSFDVKAYPDEKQIKVSVESGEVRVKENGADNDLRTIAGSIMHNQQLSYNDQNGDHTLSYVEAGDISAWKQNRLRFDNASFYDIARTLERWYDVKVTLKNNNPNLRHYTVSFNNEPVDNVLYVLEKLSGMRYQISNKNIMINLNNCKHQ